MNWKATADELPPHGDLVFVCDFDQSDLAKSFYAAWFADGAWRSHQVWARSGQFQPRYWMPIPPLPAGDDE